MTEQIKPFGRGSRGQKVTDLQTRLSALGFAIDSGELDAVAFGDSTELALKAFQQRAGLIVDGILGRETWDALLAAGYGLGDRLLYYRVPMLRGDDVAALQGHLNALGFSAGRTDGLFGPDTATGVREFQRNAGITVDGVFGPESLRVLGLLGPKAAPEGAGLPAESLRAATLLAGKRILLDAGGVFGSPAPPMGCAPELVAVADHCALRICDELSLALRALDAVPVVSRAAGDELPAPEESAAVANSMEADAVVSVGLNWTADPDARGAASYYFAGPSGPSAAGMRLAGFCQEELVAALGNPDCRIHAKAWNILRLTRAPAVVVEPFFVSNRSEAALAQEPGVQRKVATALAAALERFFAPG